jgi:hypothetical protein
MIVEHFSSSLSPIHRSSKKKSTKNSKELELIDQMDLTDIYRVFYPAAAQYSFFSAAHGTFSKIEHSLGHEASIKYKKNELTPSILSDNNRINIKLELNNSKRNNRGIPRWQLEGGSRKSAS